MINKKSKIFVAGHKGMVGSAILRKLKSKGFSKIIVCEKTKLNLLNQDKVFKFLKKKKPDIVIIAAARVGGILANSTFKDKFIYENLQIQNNLIHGSYLAKVKNLMFLGSSCIYPKFCKQPMKESYLLSGKLEETNDTYAIAKIAGIIMCNSYSKKYKLNYQSLMPPNLYGPGDNYNLETSHFFPALLKKIYLAKKKGKKYLNIWGTGKPRRELMFVEDFAEALIFFMNKKIKEPFINIGIGKDFSIDWYAKYIMKRLNVKLRIIYNKNRSDGMPKKCLDINLAKKYGWRPNNDLDRGFDITLRDFVKNR
ncbi:GDP-L-fucose synthase [Candidatus Pelagibacter sp.]|nr:GDP-L-fucose synthase [Candidatus Pelagibacter sp.]